MTLQILTSDSLHLETDSFLARAIRELGAVVTIIPNDSEQEVESETEEEQA